MSITYEGFIDSLVAMSVTGINQNLTEPPAIENRVQFPVMFPRLPSVEREVLSLDSSAGLKNVTADLVILVEREALSSNDVKFSTAIGLIDALDTALATEMEENDEIDRWTITPEVTDWGWALVATVEGSG